MDETKQAKATSEDPRRGEQVRVMIGDLLILVTRGDEKSSNAQAIKSPASKSESKSAA